MGGLHRPGELAACPPHSILAAFRSSHSSSLRKVTDPKASILLYLDAAVRTSSPPSTPSMSRSLSVPTSSRLDECTEYPADRARAEESLRLTMAWAQRSLDHFRAHQHEVPWRDPHENQSQSIFGIVQGGMHRDLRRQCAERLVEMNFDGYAIGGLSVGEPRELTLEMISEVLPLLPKDKPRYVMGVLATPTKSSTYAPRSRHDGLRSSHPRRPPRVAIHQ